uniref:Uncharacterized protein n=1 Tax=Cacopsylla melanoneura TaxID=428564 RepID=A0A8D8RJN0_9HEMI
MGFLHMKRYSFERRMLETAQTTAIFGGSVFLHMFQQSGQVDKGAFTMVAAQSQRLAAALLIAEVIAAHHVVFELASVRGTEVAPRVTTPIQLVPPFGSWLRTGRRSCCCFRRRHG